MKVKQLSLFLENKPGALSRPVKLLAKAKLNILTLSSPTPSSSASCASSCATGRRPSNCWRRKASW